MTLGSGHKSTPLCRHKERNNIMKYIKITNNVNEVSRLGLEKLGLSTKRDNDETIGQFGSGIKFAPIAAIRKGIDWAFAGNDSRGQYVLKYVVKEDEGIPCIFYSYGDYEKPSSFTADAGLLSWTDDFQIYREVISNAMDEDKLNGLGWSIDIVDIDTIESIDGEFSVYIEATDEMIKIHNDFDKYFCVKRTPIYVGKDFSIYKPYDSIFRVYTKGVMVFSDEKESGSDHTPNRGFFDYEFNNLTLNEERKVSSLWDMHYVMIRALSGITDVEIIENIFREMTNTNLLNCYEQDKIPDGMYSYGVGYNNTLWQECFDSNLPKHVIILEAEQSINIEKTINSKGYQSVPVINEGFFNFLCDRGIKQVRTILGESFKYEYTLEIEDNEKLIEAIEIVEDVLDIDLDRIVGLYNENEEDDVSANGITVNLGKDQNTGSDIGKLILINESLISQMSMQELISVLVHEWDHYSTGIGDGNNEGRMFRSLADEKIGKMVYELFKLKKHSSVTA